MFEYFELLDEQLGRRYRTLENNLRSASNSFFDSYREVVQELVRVIYRREGLYVERADGSTVEFSNKIELNRLLTSSSFVDKMKLLGVEESTQKKLRDYIAKVNGHVHKREKEISFEGVVDYLTALYNFSSPYAASLEIKCAPPSLNEMNALYAEYEKSIASLSLFEESFVTRVQGIIEENIRDTEPTPQKAAEAKPVSIELDEETLNASFAAKSTRSLAFFGGEKVFRIRKMIFLSLVAALILFANLFLFLSGPYFILFLGSFLSLVLYIITFIRTLFVGFEFTPGSRGDVIMMECLYIGPKLEGVGMYKNLYIIGIISSLISLIFELFISYASSNAERILGFSYLHIIYFILELSSLIFGYFFFFNRYKVVKHSGVDSISGKHRVIYSFKGKYYNNLDDIGLDKVR